MPRYKDRGMQRMYTTLLQLADDPNSELYWKGDHHQGALHRAAFWDGYSGHFQLTGPRRSANAIPGTLSHAAFMAGREYARRHRLRASGR
jgi:hypothetical protein